MWPERLCDEVEVVPVTTLSGSRTYQKRSQHRGFQKVGEGGKIDLFIPSERGYGEQGQQTIPGNSVLLFNVELTKVAPYVEPAPVEETKKK